MNTIDFMQAVAISGTIATFGTQILKNKYIPIPAQQYPRTAAAVIAIVSAGYVVFTQRSGSLPASIVEWVSVSAIALVGAALAYNNILSSEGSTTTK